MNNVRIADLIELWDKTDKYVELESKTRVVNKMQSLLGATVPSNN